MIADAAEPKAMNKKRGIFITFEGGEGSGKSTQARLLHAHITGMGGEAVLTLEPGGTPLGERIRKVLLDPGSAGMEPLSELLLYFAARRQHVAEVIAPALERGAAVVCDRFSDATVAYQGYGRELDRRLIGRLDRLARAGVEPDITFLVDLPVEAGLDRASARHREMGTGLEEGRFEEEEMSFHTRVRRGYLALARRHPGRIVVVDGGRRVEEVHRSIVEALNKRRHDGRRR